MKYIKLVSVFICALLYPLAVCAQETAPENAIKRIAWVVKCCGNMPSLMSKSLAAIAVMIVITVVAVKIKEVKGNE